VGYQSLNPICISIDIVNFSRVEVGHSRNQNL